jgi:hypothetical protein
MAGKYVSKPKYYIFTILEYILLGLTAIALVAFAVAKTWGFIQALFTK